MSNKKKNNNLTSDVKYYLKALEKKYKSKLTKKKLADIIDKFFCRAPANFFVKKSSDEVESILKLVIDTTLKISSKKSAPRISSSTDSSGTKIVIAQVDRPFIIRTIQEELSKLQIEVTFFLHPIIEFKEYNVSQIFIETEAKNKKETERIVKTFQESFKTLEQISKDFKLIKGELKEIINKIETSNKKEENQEIYELLKWLAKGSFVFIGFQKQIFKDKKFSLKTNYGLTTIKKEKTRNLNKLIKEKLERLIKSNKYYRISKINEISPVKNFTQLTLISILDINKKKEKEIYSFLGIFTNKAFLESSSEIPIIREKVGYIIENEGIVKNSYDHKSVLSIIDSMPVSEAFASSRENLRETVKKVLSIQNENDTRVTYRHDIFSRSASFLVFIPRDRFDSVVRNKIQNYLETICEANKNSSNYHLGLGNEPHAKLFFEVIKGKKFKKLPSLNTIEKQIAELSKSWEENLNDELKKNNYSDFVIEKYSKAFSADYKAAISPEVALFDIKNIENISTDSPINFDLEVGSEGEQFLNLYVLNKSLTLHETLPKLENCGFKIISENNWSVEITTGTIYIQKFTIETSKSSLINKKHFNQTIRSGLVEIFSTNFWNDNLNSLIVKSTLSLKEVVVLRVYTKILWQIIQFTTRKHIFDYLCRAPEITENLYKYFDTKFNPSVKLSKAKRISELAKIESSFRAKLQLVSDITQDRVLRSIFHLMANSLRTNFYHNNKSHNAISIKLDSGKVEFMERPRPMFEIFVVAPEFEGVHLRSSYIARGGLRWSERPDDYRTEILDLMNTQRFKNSIIIPSGSKGGFVLSSLVKTNNLKREELFAIVKETYGNFIRSLLDITDNRINSKVVHPAESVVHDQKDPYFVVAADKGTATFSDFANEIACREYNFWLGDAFASGGSKGYDHKKSGITARGAYECAKRHFLKVEFDYNSNPFSVVGIGDMSGDVFGNGLLATKNMSLVAAFNHKHIFIDPTPDINSAYKERKRLFKLKRSSWSDYDFRCVSNGGGVFDRFAKSIKLNKEIRKALHIDSSVNQVSGNELIKHILKAKVDLIWNGGIGTYVKASFESHTDAKDSSNDDVRINADELRARIVAEGGNLGFTQNARIEFARNGGQINTDAIDNSGGVDLSDHEVNLKILLKSLIDKKLISNNKRDKILLEVEEEVIKDVLHHNRNQALLLRLGVVRSKRNIAYFRSLIKELDALGYLNRKAQQLPSDDELVDRATKNQGLHRPELAICVLAVKNFLKDVIINSNLRHDPYLKSYLLAYFPKKLQNSYQKEILNHPLKENIISSQLTNALIDSMGISYVHRMSINKSCEPQIIVKCAIAAQLIVDLPSIEKEINKFDTVKDHELFIQLRKYSNRLLRETSSWLITYHGKEEKIDSIVKLYADNYQKLLLNAHKVFDGDIQVEHTKRLETYKKFGINPKIAKTLATGPIVVHIFEALWTANKSKKKIEKIANIYTVVVNVLGIIDILKLETSNFAVSKWENELLINTYEELKRNLSNIILKLISKKAMDTQSIKTALEKSPSFSPFTELLQEILGKPTPAALSVLSKQLKMFKI